MSANKDKPDGTDGGLALAERTQTKKPALYRVIMLNDDYTPMEFVVLILQRFLVITHRQPRKLCYMYIKKVLVSVECIPMRLLKLK